MHTRRQFIATTGAGLISAGLVGSPFAATAKPGAPHIVQVSSDLMVPKRKPDEAVVSQMLARGMTEFSGKKKPEDGWSAMFSEKDLVAIKINCLGKPCMSTHPQVVQAIIAALKSAGVREERIVVFDLFGSHMRMSGYRLTDGPQGVRYVHNKMWGYEEEWRKHPSGRVKFTQVLLKADKVISVPVIKDHSQSGVTCALKNMAFGTIINPSAHHRGGCDPGIANIYNLDPIKQKTSLIICDAALLQFDGGPQCKPAAQVPFNSLFFATDPVALDKLVWEHIDAMRQKKNLRPLHKDRRPPTHIATAASLGLGTDDRAKIKLIQTKI